MITEVQTETETVETAAPVYDVAQDTPVLAMIRTTLSAQVAEANALGDKISASKQGTGGLVHQLRETDDTDDEVILKFRARKEKVLAALLADEAKTDEHIKVTYLQSPDSFDVDAATAEFKSLKDAVKAGQAYARTAPGFTDAYLTSLPTIKGVRGASSGGGSGTGGKRPRLESVSINGHQVERTNDDGTVTANFTLAAAWLQADAGGETKVKPSDLHAACFAAAGTDDLSTLNGKAVDFSFSAGDKNYSIVVVPRVKPDTDAADTAE